MTSYGLDFEERNLTLIDLALQIKKGITSPVELASTCLYKIKTLNSTLNSFITVLPEEIILAQAKECEKSIRLDKYKGPLHGIPFSVKDLIHVKGLKFTAGSRYYSNYVSKRTATVVKKLENAGAILIGSNNLNELASGITGKNTLFGDSKNPFDTSRISGGSSGGSAVAVATGMVIFSIGTDTGGSVRVPSSLCGVVGMKPTFGNISMSGILPLSPSLDHIGIITRNTIDSQIIFDVVKTSGRQHKPTIDELTNTLPSSRILKLPRLLYPANQFLDILDDNIRNKFFELLTLLRRKGFEVLQVNFGLTCDHYKYWKTVRLYESAEVHSQKLKFNSGHLSEEVRNMLLKGSRIDRAEYLDAKRMIKKIKKKFLHIFGKENGILLLLPTTVIYAPKLRNIYVTINKKDLSVRDLLLRNTIVFNSIGFPALTIPLTKYYYLSQLVLPVGLQIVGAPHNDNLVFEAGMSIESVIAKSPKPDN
jgi:aspartyl-tRNA(Asn)/glutamyl-tRNA(Gln) amidotransferase subunit A